MDNEKREKQVLFLGFGTTALECARELVKKGWQVTGVARSERLKSEAEALGVSFVQGSIAEPENVAALKEEYDYIAIAAATKSTDTDRDPWALYVTAHQRLANYLSEQYSVPQKILLFSTTSVYGPGSALSDGTIDETSRLDPRDKTTRSLLGDKQSTRSMARNYTAAMEEVWAATLHKVWTLRIPGISKPGTDGMARWISSPGWSPPPQDRTYQTVQVTAIARVLGEMLDKEAEPGIYNLTPPKVNSLVRRAKVAAEKIDREFDWPPEADLQAHNLIVPRNLKKLGIQLTEDDG
jgi:nucleoside-diphosphate-sugar epimerase